MKRDANDETANYYLKDIRGTKPLDRKEEARLFDLCRAGDRAARDKLVKANMRFVLKVALNYQGCPVPLPDRISEGAMGLVRAIESFDPTRNLKFISYAVWWIRAYITKAVNEQGSLIRLPSNQHLRIRKALKENGRGKEMEGDIRELLQLGDTGVSFDALLPGSHDSTYQDVLADENAVNPEAEAEAQAMENLAKDILCDLPEREARVIKALYGIGRDAPQTLRQVGESIGVTHQRAQQLRDKALHGIRRNKDAIRRRYEGCFSARTSVGGAA